MSLHENLGKWRKLPLASTFQRQALFPTEKTLPIHAEILQQFYPANPMLPIEFFKLYPDQIEAGFRQGLVHSFLSSGTSQRDRSRSSFSQNGLDLYREFSLLSFRSVLARFFPQLPTPRGISFIPSTTEWPDSSLAQMIAWLGETYPLHYWDQSLVAPVEPVWVFATGFHLVAFADAGGFLPLPRGSVVIETGGTKGKTRTVTREEAYRLIERCFEVDRNHIISEYGMCELASQAYDFVDEPEGDIVSLDDRWFRFPAWAQTKILHPDHQVQEAGMGSLIVDDRIRSDICTPIRTEDLVYLRPDGSFQVKGRVAFSPLKGCSLLAEDVLSPVVERFSKVRSEPLQKIAKDIDFTRATTLHQLTTFMLDDAEFKGLIRASLESNQLADWQLRDLVASVPPSIDAWCKAAIATRNSLSSWLIIPPRTHDFAALHPLFMAALLNLRIVVRASDSSGLLRYFQTLFQDFWNFELLDSDWRLPPLDQGMPCEGLMVFGSDETILAIRNATSHPVQGFGSWITATVIHKSSWFKDEWFKDAFSLKQQGCMSSRLLIVWDEEAPQHLAPRTLNVGPLKENDQLHLAHSELAFALSKWTLLRRSNFHDMIIGYRPWENKGNPSDFLSSRPLTLPVLTVSKGNLFTLLELIDKDPLFRLISSDVISRPLVERLRNVISCNLGTANIANWTGLHGGRPLFFPGA